MVGVSYHLFFVHSVAVSGWQEEEKIENERHRTDNQLIIQLQLFFVPLHLKKKGNVFIKMN